MITNYEKICFICGKPADAGVHHLIFGRGLHNLADQDNLTAPICNSCHVLGKYRLHDNPVSEKLSKIIGQLEWEKNYIARNASLPFENMEEEAREAFRKRYDRSYL